MASRFFRKLLILAVVGLFGSATALGQTTVSFQPGVGGYNGLFELYIGITDNVNSNVDGSTVEAIFLDGSCGAGSDTQGLYRFDGILDQIPANSEIVSAFLEFTTADGGFSGNSGTAGPYAVGQLLVPFDSSTTWNSSGGGFQFMDGETTRPLANGFVDLPAETTGMADVTEIVQAWVDGEPNHGFVITAGTTDGWAVFTSGLTMFPAQFRPKLTVMYDDPVKEPSTATACITISDADDTNSMFIADGVTDLLTDTDTIVEGAAFLDGDPSDGDPDLQALIRFDSIFVSQGGVVPDDAEIVEATMLVTTSSCLFSTNSATDEEFGIRPILNEWDGNSSFNDLTFGSVIDSEFGLIQDAVAEFDVTSVVEGIQNGDDNFGFNIQVQDTFGGTNGWAIEVSTSPLAPQLKVTYLSDDACDFAVGDVNQDGAVSLLDVDPFVTLLTAGTFQCEADINGDGGFTLLDVDPFVALLTGG